MQVSRTTFYGAVIDIDIYHPLCGKLEFGALQLGKKNK
jgi:hypothetical protein